MKKLFLCAAFIASTFATPIFAQNTIKTTSTIPVLSSYYELKNALINSNSIDAKTASIAFLKVINDVDVIILPTRDRSTFITLRNKLNADAQRISESQNLAQQRDSFSNLSLNFIQLARLIKLGDDKIYYDYCPMKKSYWLSADAVIKNPYYGKAMLTCGKVIETLNK
jgi:hypothetical protein